MFGGGGGKGGGGFINHFPTLIIESPNHGFSTENSGKGNYRKFLESNEQVANSALAFFTGIGNYRKFKNPLQLEPGHVAMRKKSYKCVADHNPSKL